MGIAAHGTRSRYNAQGCRCDPCKRACRDYSRKRRSKSKATVVWGPTPETVAKLGRPVDLLGRVCG